MAQRALNRWWWPSVMMFGPSDADSPNTENSVKWKIKRYTNDELRQKFVDAIVPQAEKIGLTVPDKDLKWDKKRNNGQGGYSYGEINWDEFWRVVRGDGPMNNERISAKQKAWNEGSWVRAAAHAHALKKQTALQAAE